MVLKKESLRFFISSLSPRFKFLPENTLRKPENDLSVFQDKLHISNGFAKARYEGKALCRVFPSKGYLQMAVKSSQRGDLEGRLPGRFLLSKVSGTASENQI